ncbi:MAG TPA: cytochrome c [Stellaceae bacterium]|nr:cytochrome c [Stellaceae bacterium]
MRFFLPLALALAFALPGAALAQDQAQAPPGDAAKGKTTYMADGCFECHGTVGQGSVATGGPKVSRTALPFDAFVQQLRQPSNEMPPYEAGVVSDADAANIYAFLHSVPAPKKASEIPLLNQ